MEVTEIKTINPYWDDVKEWLDIPRVLGDDDPWHQTWSEFDRILRQASGWQHRDGFVRTYAWAVADPASVAFVARYLGPRAVEIGAGNGYWAWQIAQCGVDIVAYDNKPPDQDINIFFCPRDEKHGIIEKTVKTWFPVQRGDVEEIIDHSDRTLFLCWPPYDDPLAHQALVAYRGQRIVFIGEYEGGCTGSDAFFELLDAEWREVDSHDIMQWYGINDVIRVYVRIAGYPGEE